MQVEQKVHGIDDRTHFSSPCKLAGSTRCVVEYLAGPYAVEVLIDETGGVGLGRIEAGIRRDVRERERQTAAPWPQFQAQQRIYDNRATHLIAVRQRVDHYVLTGHAGVEGVHIGNARPGLFVDRDIGERDLDRIMFSWRAHARFPWHRYLIDR